MKEQKIIFWVSIAIAIGALILGVIGEWKIDKVWGVDVPIMFGHRTFFIDFCMGAFSGAALSAVISLISYFNKKQESMFLYWMQLEEHVQALNLFGSRYFKYGSTTDECIEKIISSEEVLVDIFALEKSYTELAKIRKELSFFRQNSKIKEMTEKTFELSGTVNLELTQLACVHSVPCLDIKIKRKYVNQYSAETSNSSLFSDAVEQLQKLIGIEITKIDCEKGTKESKIDTR